MLFSVNGVCGYPLADALKKEYHGLDGRDDKIFTKSGYSISIRVEVCSSGSTQSNDGLKSCLQWLPYEKWAKQVGKKIPMFHCININEFHRFIRGGGTGVTSPVQNLLLRWRRGW